MRGEDRRREERTGGYMKRTSAYTDSLTRTCWIETSENGMHVRLPLSVIPTTQIKRTKLRRKKGKGRGKVMEGKREREDEVSDKRIWNFYGAGKTMTRRHTNTLKQARVNWCSVKNTHN